MFEILGLFFFLQVSFTILVMAGVLNYNTKESLWDRVVVSLLWLITALVTLVSILEKYL